MKLSFAQLYHLYSHRIYLYLFLLAFALQIAFWNKTEAIKPTFDIVPPAPSKELLSAVSFGDNEFLFYSLALRFQNSGDVFAGFAPLKNYNYQNLYDWMKRLDEINNQSHLIPALASYYYSQTQNRQDTKYIIRYLDEHAAIDPVRNWWWLVQAVYIARDLLNDRQLALELAYKLSAIENEEAPLWTHQLPAIISKELGDGCAAYSIIKNLIDEGESGKRKISAKEMDFMNHFIKERLTRIKKSGFNPASCPSESLKQKSK